MDNMDKLMEALDRDWPDWYIRLASQQQLQGLARANGFDNAGREWKNLRTSVAFDCMNVVRAALAAGIVK
jgi:predicted GNAT family N-acyltransferase